MISAEGYVTEYNAVKMQAKVKFPEFDLESDWLSIGFMGTNSYTPLKEGVLVGCIVTPNCENGFIICRLYDETTEFENVDDDIFYKKFTDGTQLKYDQKNHVLTANIEGAANIKASNKITLTGDVAISGALSVSETLAVDKEISSKTNIKASVIEDSKGTMMNLRLAHKYHTHSTSTGPTGVAVTTE